jgi:hypothetical protein
MQFNHYNKYAQFDFNLQDVTRSYENSPSVTSTSLDVSWAILVV